jgi:putative ATPase
MLFEEENKKMIDSVPLAFRLVPETLEEFVGQEHILGPDKLLRRAILSDRISSLIFFGPPGSGKTALAKIIAKRTTAHFVELNAVNIGVGELKEAISVALYRKKAEGKRTIILLDEIHHFNRLQQDILLPYVESGDIILIGITTENPYFYINHALLSRSLVFEFYKLKDKDLEVIAYRALTDKDRGFGNLKIEMHKDALQHLIKYSDGDARRLLNSIEIGVLTTPPEKDGVIHFTLQVAEESIQKKTVLYDRSGDEHYDTISAFIKSVRGSDPDAAIYWLCKMLYAGEDPRYILRRLLILASEDIGNADPMALALAASALSAVELVGMPEGKLILAQVTLYLACAPKSNASYLALKEAWDSIEKERTLEVPNHLKDSHLDSAKRGHGKGYKYPHDYSEHFVIQDYLPVDKIFYRPAEIGYEKEIKVRLEEWRKRKKKIE